MNFEERANHTTMQTTTSKPARKSNRNEARDAFIHNVASAREFLTLLTRHLDDHMGLGPDEINWADAGDAARLVETLKDAARGCNLIGE